MGVPMPFHLGYHESPIPGLLKGFGHIGLGGTLGWADPATGSAFAFVHNRLLTPMVFDMAIVRGHGAPDAQCDRRRAQQRRDDGSAVRRDVPGRRRAQRRTQNARSRQTLVQSKPSRA